MSEAQDYDWMARALALARETTALASPNPQVGCVLVREGEVIGEGAHRYAARDHAEIVALAQAAERGLSTQGAIAYVTLEPCAHHGRTPPCADALVRAGIGRAVVATEDPNPLVSGQGLARLRAAGIAVTLGPGEAEARALNNAFAHFIQHRRPFVTLKGALSVDGYLAPRPTTRTGPPEPFWLTGPLARAEVHRLRHSSDAILTGVGTVLADDPLLTDRSGLARRRPLLRVVLDTHLRTPLTARVVRTVEADPEFGPDTLILCGAEASPARAEALTRAGVAVERLPCHGGRLSLSAALDSLAGRALTSLLLETGSQLNAAFLEQHLVDAAVLLYAPIELGPGSVPFAAGGPPSYLLQEQLKRAATRELGPDVMVSGILHDPWPESRRADWQEATA